MDPSRSGSATGRFPNTFDSTNPASAPLLHVYLIRIQKHPLALHELNICVHDTATEATPVPWWL